MNIFNISSQYNFLESLFDWVLKNFPKNISKIQLFLPSTRSCREFKQIFIRNFDDKSIILPKIKAISDLNYEDFFDFLPNEEAKKIIDEILEIKVISDIDYLFFLSNEVSKTNVFKNISLTQNLNIALQLRNLFDEIEKDEISLDILEEIDDSDLSMHRQVTLEFLKNFHVHVKNSLIRQNIFFSTSYQNFITRKFIELLEKYGSKSPLIVAGSTGTIAAGRNLIKGVSKQENGFIIFQAFDKNIFGDLEENHPQFLLQQLVKFIEIDTKKILEIGSDKFKICQNERIKFISNITLPYEETIKWQNLESVIDVTKVQQDLEQNFKIITAKNYLEEAKIIAITLQNAVLEKKKCAVITNNSDLSQFLKNELNTLSLNFNDSRNIEVKDSKLINFILLILNLIKSDFGSYELLSVMKNPLFMKGSFLNSKIIENFENDILRQERICLGFDGIKAKIISLNEEKLNKLFTDFYNKLSPIINISKLSITSYLKLLIEVIEKLSDRKWHELLEIEEAGFEIFEFFEKLKLQHNFTIKKEESLAIFNLLFSQISYFEKSDSLSPIQLLSNIESRLLNYDLVIVASLNEGDFPRIESENWLGKKIRKDLGIDNDKKQIGQNAYDFCNYLSNSSVILSRSLITGNSESIPSSFFLKFYTLCQKLEVKLQYLSEILEINQKAAKQTVITRSKANPLVKFRPKKLAITDISKLFNDPYSIYAKRVLLLKELKKIDFESGYAEFGSFIHKALEEFIKNPCDSKIFLNKIDKIFDKYFFSKQAKLTWLPKFENIFNDFIKEETSLEILKNYVEIPVKIIVEGVEINGKIDRVILKDNNLIEILDYKTGQVPTIKDVISGLEPQLTIAALALLEKNSLDREFILKSLKISALKYVKLSATIGNETKVISNKIEEIESLILSAKEGLKDLLKYFNDENNSYITSPNLNIYKENEYSHLSRVKELY